MLGEADGVDWKGVSHGFGDGTVGGRSGDGGDGLNVMYEVVATGSM